MSEDKSREMFPASARIAIGGTDLKGINTIEMYLIRYGKQSFGMYASVFQEGKIREEYINYFKPSEAQKATAEDDKLKSIVTSPTRKVQPSQSIPINFIYWI